MIVYGEDISRLRPRTYTIIFVTCDLIALILQAAGGAITSVADEDQQSLKDTGVNIMIAGLGFQVASLTLFIVLASEFALRVRKASEELRNPFLANIRSGWKWKVFLFGKWACFLSKQNDSLISVFRANLTPGLAGAILTIFIRSCFRVAELQGGFSSDLANDEITLMVLESAMITIACFCLTAGHPALVMGRTWSELKERSSSTKMKPTKSIDSEASPIGPSGYEMDKLASGH